MAGLGPPLATPRVARNPAREPGVPLATEWPISNDTRYSEIHGSCKKATEGPDLHRIVLPFGTLVAPTMSPQTVLTCAHIERARPGPHGMLKLELEREDGGRWLAEVPALPGVMAYGATAQEAATKTDALALRVIADRFECGGSVPAEVPELFAAA